MELAHYARRHARRLMSQQGKKLWLNQKTKVVGDVKQRFPRERARVYDEKVVTVLIKLWKMLDYICGKRLQPALAKLLAVLERHNELSCDHETRAKLVKISAATIDRLLTLTDADREAILARGCFTGSGSRNLSRRN